MSSRLSLDRSALRDSSNGRSSSRSRNSPGGGALRAETPEKDRLIALEQWRATRARDHDAENRENDAKRPRTQLDIPPLPPSSSNQPKFVEASGGTTALERFRMKKLIKIQQEQGQLPPKPHKTDPSSGLVLSEDFDDDSFLSSTPRRRLGPARRRSNSSFRESMESDRQLRADSERISLSQNIDSGILATRSSSRQRSSVARRDSEQGHHTVGTIMSETNNIRTPPESGGGSVEAGLRSRLREMELRIEQLETDKTKLLVAKAPLEARLQQKEEESLKREQSFLEEVENCRQSIREAADRYRDLQALCDAKDEEIKVLRDEARKASSSVTLRTSRTETSRWDKMYQNDRDRENAELKEKIREYSVEINYLRGEKVSLEKQLQGTNLELNAVMRNLDRLQDEYDEIAASRNESSDSKIKLEHLTIEHIATAAQLNAVCQEMAYMKARTEAEMIEHKSSLEKLHFDLSVARAAATNSSSREQGEVDTAVMQAKLEELQRRVVGLESELLRGEEIRRQMHNKIQELRGNIRVFVRTRPFLPADGDHKESAIDVLPDGESLIIDDSRTNKTHSFKFDKVFPPSAGQDHVFQEVADFVQSALDGYHVCLFSYGQTGSGKTHTMQGSGNRAMRGIIPRAVEQVLNHARLLQGQKWDFKLSTSFLEIYNEELRDLLVGQSEKPQKKLAIKRSEEGKSFVDGLSEVKIDISDIQVGMEQLDEIMSVAARARSVASTAMNAKSSRSHSVFMLHLRGFNEETGAEVHGDLNLCDLAGSERLDRSDASSDAARLRETQSINKSLSCLGDVFNALSTGASHVPYRNSKLTYLLQDCLSGDGKTLMFVNLSPTGASSSESLCSLRFAQRVNQVELGKPTKHIQYKKH